jgi:hypothetical protein
LACKSLNTRSSRPVATCQRQTVMITEDPMTICFPLYDRHKHPSRFRPVLAVFVLGKVATSLHDHSANEVYECNELEACRVRPEPLQPGRQPGRRFRRLRHCP